jgi:hypothetical protein
MILMERDLCIAPRLARDSDESRAGSEPCLAKRFVAFVCFVGLPKAAHRRRSPNPCPSVFICDWQLCISAPPARDLLELR